MQTYLFDVKLFAALRIQAETEEEAREKLGNILDAADIRIGGDEGIVTGEVSMDGEADFNGIDEDNDYTP